MFSFENLITAIRANSLWAICVNVPIAAVSYAAGAVRGSGLIAGLMCGLVIYTFGGYRAFLILLFFFLAGSIASKIGADRKAGAGAAADDKGARGAGSVLGKCTVGAAIAVLIGASGTVDEANAPLSALLRIGYAGAFAAALADTLASEIGPLFGGGTYMLKSFRSVPHGTSGAVSLGGTVSGLVGALLVGALATAMGLIPGGAIFYLVISAFIAIMFESNLRSSYPGSDILHKQLPNGMLTLVGALLAILLALILGR